jgi:hypothetical protein
MLRFFALKNNSDIVRTAVIIAVILGLSTSIFFIVIEKETYSSLYVIPNSIIHNSDNTVLYQYGVKSSESKSMEYTLETFLNETLIKTKKFSLNKGETLDERDKIMLPADIQYPAKISLRLTTDTSAEEVHFWLK